VRAYPVQNDGAGYKATTANLLTSPDSWYRPADVCVAPDGSVLIADWHDAGVGGHNMADRVLETMTGRIYRVAPAGSKYAMPKLDFSTDAGCIAALQSPNMSARYLAWTALHKRGAQAREALTKLYQSSDSRMRARALQLLARIPNYGQKQVLLALQDKDSNIRITALRIARQLKMDTIPLVHMLARDSSAQVRRECAIALRHSSSPEAPKLWAMLASQHAAGDRWYLEALGIAADQQENACFDAWMESVSGNWNTPAGREIVWRSRASKVPAIIAKIVTDKNATAADKDRFMRSLDFIKGPEKDAALAEIATAALN
jgi:hypothetical protein